MHNSIIILDDNVLNSANDGFERIWIKAKSSKDTIYLGIAYYPNDGKDTTESSDINDHM